MGKLIIELLLDAEFLLRLAQRCPGLGEVLALFHGVVMFRDLLQRILQLLLLLGGTFQIGFLLSLRVFCRILKRLLSLWRRVFQHSERIIGITHRFAFVLFQNILFVRFGPDQILQRVHLRIELLLLGKFMGDVFRLFDFVLLRHRLGLLLDLLLFFSESRCELRDRRSQFLQALACFDHVRTE